MNKRARKRLKEAIEKKIFADLKDVVKITTSAKTPDPDQLRRINEVVDRLVDAYSRLLGARLCAVGLFQDDFTKIDAVSTRGTTRSLRSISAVEAPQHIIDRIYDEWTKHPRGLEFNDEPWFEDFGEAQLSNGRATVTLDRDFAAVVRGDKMPR